MKRANRGNARRYGRWLGERYGAYGEKVQYGKKTVGVIRSTVVVGPDGKVVRHWPKVAKAETHPAEVLEFLLMQQGVVQEKSG